MRSVGAAECVELENVANLEENVYSLIQVSEKPSQFGDEDPLSKMET